VTLSKVTQTTQHVTTDAKHNVTLQLAYARYAGIPRVCMRFFSDADDEIRAIQKALRDVKSFDTLLHAINTEVDYPASTSHRLVKVEPENDSYTSESYEPVSEFVAGLVFEEIRKHKDAKLSDSIFENFRNPDKCGYAGILFETAAHHTFQQHDYEMKPTSITPDATILTIKISGIAHRFFSLDVREEKKYSCNVSEKFLNRYFIPWPKTQDSVDALWISMDITVFFQMTK
jgi:hypothetical protein